MSEPSGTSKPSSTSLTGRWRIVVLYLAIAVSGFLVGNRGLSPLALAATSERLTPLARVGWALERDSLPGEPSAFETLGADLETAAASVPTSERGAFELMVAVRGLRSRGRPDWNRALELCTALHWSHCEQAALEELARRSRP